MSRIAICAHCGQDNSNPRSSLDYGSAFTCPACDESVCPSCRAMSGPTVCGSYADGRENLAEIIEGEQYASDWRAQKLGRLVAWERATNPLIAGNQYPLSTERVDAKAYWPARI